MNCTVKYRARLETLDVVLYEDDFIQIVRLDDSALEAEFQLTPEIAQGLKKVLAKYKPPEPEKAEEPSPKVSEAESAKTARGRKKRSET